jgi:branched-chain amino acid transport system ATP-binding protein
VTRLPVHARVRLGICRSFQIVNVFPKLTALENVLLPAQLARDRGGGAHVARAEGEREDEYARRLPHAAL